MDETARDQYYVAVKLLLRDGDKLLITHDIFGDWDLPGGRIRVNEMATPLDAVLRRKINEELGPALTYELGEPRVFFRVELQEQTLNQKVRIFAVGFAGRYRGGEIKLGEHHDRLEWVDVASFKPEAYFTGGWLTGVQEYLAQERGR